MMITAARYLIVAGLIFLLAGAGLYLAARSGLDFSQIPGNIRIERGNFTCVFALGASIFLSILLTVLLNLLSHWLTK